MSDKLILLVEDSKKVQNFNKRMLERAGFAAASAMTLAAARACLAQQTPGAIILDIGMPDGSGLDFLRELRETSQIPVLLLTGYGETKDIVQGFQGGCNDYLTKPYTFEVLHVRLLRLLQNAEQVPETIAKGPFSLNLTSMIAYRNGEDMLLTQKEFALLLLFLQNEGKTMSAEYIYEKVWGQNMAGDIRAVKFQVSHLRKKIEGSGYAIPNLRGGSYRFEPKP